MSYKSKTMCRGCKVNFRQSGGTLCLDCRLKRYDDGG